MLIYLLRHGLTEYNAQKRYQGSGIFLCRRRGAESCVVRTLIRRLSIFLRCSVQRRPRGSCSPTRSLSRSMG